MKTKKKYLVFPGTIESKNDGQVQYVSAYSLIALYRVDRRECIIVTEQRDLAGRNQHEFIHLEPNWDGRYETFISDIEKLTKIG